jgi:4-amino-4-deoxy-L-arabinose transferase-like glycosyltransferase
MPGRDRLRRFLSWRVYAIPAIVLLAAILPHLDQGDFRADAGWYSAIGLQAWKTGHLWTLYGEPGQPYFNKPPLVFWIHGLFLDLLGIKVWVARLPSVLSALGCVLATVAIARELSGRRIAIIAGCVLALSLDFLRRIREVSLDMWQTFFLLLALYLIVRAVCRGRAGLIAAAGVPIGLALMCKPLVGFVALPIAAIWLVTVGRARWIGWLVLAGLIAAAVAGPWHLSMALTYGPEFTRQYFGVQIVERASGGLQDGHATRPSPFFYLIRIGLNYWPWLAAVALAVVSWCRAGRMDRAAKLGVVWTLSWLILLSAFADRRDRYGIPLFPGLAIIAALGLAPASFPAGAGVVRWLMRWIAPIAAAVGVLLAILPLRLQTRPEQQWLDLFTWVRSQGLETRGGEKTWQGAFDGARGARLYLEFGWWPITTRDHWGNLLKTPPPGSLIVYHRRDGWTPGPNEERLFNARDLTVTRLGEGGWNPVVTPDPGE